MVGNPDDTETDTENDPETDPVAEPDGGTEAETGASAEAAEDSTRTSPTHETDVNDPGRYEHRWALEQDRVFDHPVAEDAAEIESWMYSFPPDLKPGSKEERVSAVRIFSLRSHQIDGPPLVEMDFDDYNRLIGRLENGKHPSSDVPDDGYLPGTVRETKNKTRIFFRDHLAREWADRIEPGQPEQTPVKRETIFTPEEADALLREAGARNPRDKAFLGLLLTTGLRVSAALSLRVGDVRNLQTQTGTVTINENATGRKGARGQKLLIWATPYVSNWLAVHPRKDDLDAPLFCKLKDGPTYERGEAVSADSMRKQLKKIGRGAGVEKTVNPHRFRHTAFTWLVLDHDQIGEGEIRDIANWGDDSSQFSRYVHLLEDEETNQLAKKLGLDTDESRTMNRPALKECSWCEMPLAHLASRCDACGAMLSPAASQTPPVVDAIPDAADAAAVETDDAAVREALYHMGRALESDDDLRETFVKAFLPDDAKGDTPAPSGGFTDRPHE